MTTLAAHATASNVKLSTYPGRPTSIGTPHAFVDNIQEENVLSGHLMQRTVTVTVVILWGTFDSKAAVEQKDEFVDGFAEYLRDVPNYAAAGASSIFRFAGSEDDPTFTPDWLPREVQRPYFATRMTLEGYREQ